jgi:tRNA-dihydrouridine synthase B
MIQIGPYILKNGVFLAPMAGVSDRAFRDICAGQGIGFAASEMISSDTTLHASNKTQHRIARASNDLPHAVQIVGSEPHTMAEAAAFNVSQGAQIIDINMGCPAKKVCNKAAGSALLEFPDRVKAILEAVVKSVDVPVTLKIRTGPCRATRNAVAIAKLAESAGITCLAVHGRTRADRFSGEAEYDTIAYVKQSISIPVIANGDIKNAEQSQRVMDYTEADGVMIGRAAQGNPWLLRDIVASLNGEATPKPPSDTEKLETLHVHLKSLYALYGEYRGVRIARKHIAWYCKKQQYANLFRSKINLVETSAEQLALTESFFIRPESFTAAA